MHVERELQVDPHDFRLWVCLHEETHRVQFTAVPWMRDHLRSEMSSIVDAVHTDPAQLLSDAVKKIGDLVSGKAEGSLLELFSSSRAEGRDRADHRRDEPARGPRRRGDGRRRARGDPDASREIRRKFTQRRKGLGGLDRLIRRLMGLDQKMAQYRDGAVFIRAVVDKVGMDGFNAVWAEPANLPTKAEILAPAPWLARVHG